MHYRYVKAIPKSTLLWLKLAPLVLAAVGLVLLTSGVAPILFYQFFVSPRFAEMASPVPENNSVSQTVLGENLTNDMTRINNWFPAAPRFSPRPSKITHYTLSIPKLKIKDAVVKVGGEDLKQSLIHYEGTAFPGQFGNTVVFGHSVLPQFFNPKNYLTIFSTLPTLKKKDEILVDFDGVSYKYVIEEMFEVQPEDVSVLEQQYDDAYLTLITCVPPGTYLRRLVVKARLQEK